MSMRKNSVHFISLILFFLLACNLSNIQPTPLTPVAATNPPVGDLGFGKITGIVTDAETGVPVLGAVVTCTHFSYATKESYLCNLSVTNDASGRFVFENIFFHDTDTITLTVQAKGYNTFTARYNAFTFPALDANIQLSSGASDSTSDSAGYTITTCPMFPADNFWNTPINTLPTHPQSDSWIQSIGAAESFHMDFGSGEWDGGPIGIPYNIVAGSTILGVVPVFYYPDESNDGPYLIPENPNIEWGSDHHILVVDADTCTLYEIYDASFDNGQWSGGSGAIWNLSSNVLRPDTWTSADAAGLPILPGLVRYDEIAAGEINHALRFTAEDTAGYIWPARHQTSDPADGIPPMGARFRLKADYDISGFPREMQIILQALKTYGIVLADNGSNWYVSGAPDDRWDNDMLHLLDVLTGSDFEAVDASVLLVDENSGEAK